MLASSNCGSFSVVPYMCGSSHHGVVVKPLALTQGSRVRSAASPVCWMILKAWPRLHMTLAVGGTLDSHAYVVLQF